MPVSIASSPPATKPARLERVTYEDPHHARRFPSRSQEVVDFLFARERCEDFDIADFDACMATAVHDVVAKQKAAGVDVVSDGETSKISYATYVKDRYTGFSGDSKRNAPADLKLFPRFLERLANDGERPSTRVLNARRCKVQGPG